MAKDIQYTDGDPSTIYLPLSGYTPHSVFLGMKCGYNSDRYPYSDGWYSNRFIIRHYYTDHTSGYYTIHALAICWA